MNKALKTGGLILGGVVVLSMLSPKQDSVSGGGGGLFQIPYLRGSAGGTSDSGQPDATFNFDFPSGDFENAPVDIPTSTSTPSSRVVFNSQGGRARIDSETGEGVLINEEGEAIGSTSEEVFEPVGSGSSSKEPSTIPRNSNSLNLFPYIPIKPDTLKKIIRFPVFKFPNFIRGLF